MASIAKLRSLFLSLNVFPSPSSRSLPLPLLQNPHPSLLFSASQTSFLSSSSSSLQLFPLPHLPLLQHFQFSSVREEQRWFRERDSLLRQISDLTLQVQALERRLLAQEVASSDAVANVAALLQALKDKNLVLESGSNSQPQRMVPVEKEEKEPEEEVMSMRRRLWWLRRLLLGLKRGAPWGGVLKERKFERCRLGSANFSFRTCLWWNSRIAKY